MLSVIVLSAFFASAPISDTVVIRNGSGEPVTLMVKGMLAGRYVADQHFVGDGSRIAIGNFLPSGRVDEVIAFTHGRPVAITSDVAWTAGADVVEVVFDDPIEIPLTVWILSAPFDRRTARIRAGLAFTADVWLEERMGLVLGDVRINDATRHPARERYLDFRCDQFDVIQREIGRTEGRLNVYVVDTINGAVDDGETCEVGSVAAFLASRADPSVLAHELGHNLGLDHFQATFGGLNLMDRGLGEPHGCRLRAGQLFRAHFQPTSALNFLYQARPGQPQRECPREGDDLCASFEWPDFYEPPERECARAGEEGG